MPNADLTTLNIRGIERRAVERAKRAAAARGMTVGQYVAALVGLHEAARELVDNGKCRDLRGALERLDLQTVEG